MTGTARTIMAEPLGINEVGTGGPCALGDR
jgi:hypothetical protein